MITNIILKFLLISQKSRERKHFYILPFTWKMHQSSWCSIKLFCCSLIFLDRVSSLEYLHFQTLDQIVHQHQLSFTLLTVAIIVLWHSVTCGILQIIKTVWIVLIHNELVQIWDVSKGNIDSQGDLVIGVTNLLDLFAQYIFH